MTCDNQPIADMLVPYVEGTLVEAERLQVADHLRHCPACRDEARRLREAILEVRNLFSAGFRPVTSRHPAAEDLAGLASEPADLPETLRRDLSLHLLECEDCASHMRLLREMDKDLQGRVAPGDTPLLLPRALREEIERVFPGSVATEPAAKEEALPLAEHLTFLLSRFNWRPVLATGLAAVVLTVGFLFATSGPKGDVALKSQPTAVPSAASRAATVQSPAAPAPQAPAEVFLTVGAGRAEEAARVLDREKIPYENRDGRLYLAAGDLQRARQAVDAPPSEELLADAAAPPSATEAREDGDQTVAQSKTEVAGAEASQAAPASPGPEPANVVPESAPEPRPSAPAARRVEAEEPAPAPLRPRAPVATPRPQSPVVRTPAAAPRPQASVVRTPAAAPSRPVQGASAPAPGATAVPRPAAAARPTAAPVGSGVSDDAPPPRVVALVDKGVGTIQGRQEAAGPGAGEGLVPTPALGSAPRSRPSASTAAPAVAERAREAAPPEVRGAGSNRAPAAVAVAADHGRAAEDASSSGGTGRAAALEPRARQLVQGHSVTVRDGAGGLVEVVVVLNGNLSNQEKNALRRQLRAELGLRDTDTITLR